MVESFIAIPNLVRHFNTGFVRYLHNHQNKLVGLISRAHINLTMGDFLRSRNPRQLSICGLLSCVNKGRRDHDLTAVVSLISISISNIQEAKSFPNLAVIWLNLL